MNPEIKELWIAALESGEYKQGSGVLRSWNDKFCCLGVLCDLAVKAGIVEWEEGAFHRVADGRAKYPPKSVVKWSGIGSHNGILPDGDSLATLNDYEGLSFAEIAQVIREQF